MVLVFCLARASQAEGVGVYATVMTIFTMARFGCGVGFESLIPRELPRDLTQTNRYLIHAGLVAPATGLALMIILDILVPHLDYLPQTRSGIYIISSALIPVALQIVLDATFIAHQKAEFITVISLSAVLVRVLVSVLLLRLGFSVINLFIVHAALIYVALFGTIYFLRRHIVVPRWEFDWSFLLNMLRKLKVFVGLSLLNALFSQIEIVILSLARDETQVGLYVAALKLITVWSILHGSYLSGLLPVLTVAYQESKHRAASIQNGSIKYLSAIAFPLTVGVMVVADGIINLFYGPGFEESISTLQLLSWCLLLGFYNDFFWRVMLVQGRQHLVLRGQFIAEVLRVFLALLLTSRFGCLGAAWALIGRHFTYAVYHICSIRRSGTPLPLVQLVWRFAAASAVMGAFVWTSAPWVNLFLLVPLAAVFYAVLIVVMRAFSPDDLELLWRVLKRERDIQLERT